jgi:hypothetical protein
MALVSLVVTLGYCISQVLNSVVIANAVNMVDYFRQIPVMHEKYDPVHSDPIPCLTTFYIPITIRSAYRASQFSDKIFTLNTFSPK